MSLYHKYRPKILQEFIGNINTIQSLGQILNRPIEEIPHAFLFVGQSGCGKTTLARITVNNLGCNNDFDFKELDSAHFRGIETIREIRQQMILKPLQSKCRAYLLDEVHQLSKDAQSALLKALEDTPKHVYFLLATTDPQKLLKTIVNRCMVFNVSPLPDNKIFELLKFVSRKERKRLSDTIFEQIIKYSLGSPRMALVLLDKIIDLNPEQMQKAVEQEAIKESQIIELCKALVKNESWNKIAMILKGLGEEEPENIRRAVLGYFSSVMLNNGDMRIFEILDCFRDNYYDSGRAGLIMSCYEVLGINKQ